MANFRIRTESFSATGLPELKSAELGLISAELALILLEVQSEMVEL